MARVSYKWVDRWVMIWSRSCSRSVAESEREPRSPDSSLLAVIPTPPYLYCNSVCGPRVGSESRGAGQR